MVAAVTAALVLGACSSGDAAEDDDLGVQPIEDSEPPTDDGSEEPVPDPDDDAAEPDPEPEPEEPDPFAIPDEIDEAYVDLVMNELLAIDSAVLRDVLSREPGTDLQEEDFERLRAIFSGPQLAHVGDNFLRYATDSESRGAFRPLDELGEIRWETRRVVEANDGCIVAIGYYDLRDVSVAPFAEEEFTLASLASLPDGHASVQSVNRTPWRMHDLNQLINLDDEPVPEEDWDRINYDDAIHTTCASEGNG